MLLEQVRRYGRARPGQPIISYAPAGRLRRVTVLGALTPTGLTALMTMNGGLTGPGFLAYLETILGPTLRPGQTVVLDNLSSHKVDGVRERIHAQGCNLLYLPPYSPDLNPIELAWAKLKRLLENQRCDSFEDFDSILCHAAASISPSDAQNWFRHCGYRSLSTV